MVAAILAFSDSFVHQYEERNNYQEATAPEYALHIADPSCDD